MPQVLCIHCGKAFRTASGLAWHLERIHSTLDEPRPDEPVQRVDQQAAEALRLEQNPEADLPGYDEDEQAAAHAELFQMVEELVEDRDRLKTEIRVLSDRVEHLNKAASSGVDSLNQKLGELHNQVSSLRDDMAGIKEITMSLCRVLWPLDVSHKQGMLLVDAFAAEPSSEEMKKAREVIRRMLGSRQIGPAVELRRILHP